MVLSSVLSVFWLVESANKTPNFLLTPTTCKYYPPNINRSRCCDQAICTECFVQIKRSEPTTTHIVSEPAACPYCVQENFGIIYTPPPWRGGLGSEVGLFDLFLRPNSKKIHSMVAYHQTYNDADHQQTLSLLRAINDGRKVSAQTVPKSFSLVCPK